MTLPFGTILGVALLAFASGCGSEKTPTPESLPTEEDIAVLSTALSHFAKADFQVEIRYRIDSPPTNRTMIVIADRSNTETDFIAAPSLDQATEEYGRRLSGHVKREMRRRNSVAVQLESLRAENASFILAPSERLSLSGMEFQESFPDARAYVKPWLPAYARNKRSALVLFSFGPSHHATVATYILDKGKAEWKIVWHDFAYYL